VRVLFLVSEKNLEWHERPYAACSVSATSATGPGLQTVRLAGSKYKIVTMMCPKAAFVFFVLILPSLYKTRSKRKGTGIDHTVQKHSSWSCLGISVARFIMAVP